MSNHYHLVLKVDGWSNVEVAIRWKQLFNGHIMVDRWLTKPDITQAEKTLELIHIWRVRLYDLGWYMRCLNESIAVQANKEDNCKSRFWEGRFKYQALLDKTALLVCMAYVDDVSTQPSNLLAFIVYQAHISQQIGLPFKLIDYFELLEWIGCCVREDKRGAIPKYIKPLFERFNVNEDDWLSVIFSFNRHFINAAGSHTQMKPWANFTQRK